MPRPITVRLPADARRTLDLVIHRTQRSVAWLLTEAIYDAGQAYAHDPTILDKYLSAAVGPDLRRTSFHVTDAAHTVLASLAAGTNRRPANLARAAWLHWTSVNSVEQIVAFSGAVRPDQVG